jgi:hemolysin D
MAATVEIKTGSRRILEFIFSPLLQITGGALRER